MKVEDKVKRDTQEVVLGHSSFRGFDEKGWVVMGQNGGACYSAFGYSKKKPIDRLFLCYPPSLVSKCNQPELWCDWVINRSPVKDAFITKDALAGLEGGFELDTSQPRCIMMSGAMLLRNQFERASSWGFAHFLDLGITELEAYVMSLHFIVNEVVPKIFSIARNYHNSNHFIHMRNQNFDVYEGKTYQKDTVAGNLKEGYSGDWKSLSGWVWRPGEPIILPELCSQTVPSKTAFGSTNISVIDVSKENVTKILSAIKGKTLCAV